MTETESESFRNEIFKSGYERNQKWKEKLTGWIKPTELEAAYPVSVRLRLEEQRHLLRNILIEGNNLLPWYEPTTDLDELEKELTIYAEKRHSKNPGDEFSEYAFDIVCRIRLYRDKEALIEIEKEQHKKEITDKETTPDTQAPEQKQANNLTDAECIQRLIDTGFIMINPRTKDRTVYLVKKVHNVLEVFDEFAKMTGSEKRARAIMFQNMSGVKSTLDRHRPKRSLKT
jgi:hypothetical protein